MAVNIIGLIAIIVFYMLILVIGIIAARKAGKNDKTLSMQEQVMMAGRNIGFALGIFTMTATWVGGGYINGTAEAIVNEEKGLLWCQAPIGYSVSLIIGGLFFTERMRKSGFTTLLDPFLCKYGRLMGCLLYLPALSGELFWSAAILNALGATLKVILDLNLSLSIIISAAIALLYTLIGGLYSVAYTDVVQLICIFIGLWVGIPFAMNHEASGSIANNTEWFGEIKSNRIGGYIDYYLLLIFGGIPWQVYWQRALSARTVKISIGLSIIGGLGCLLMAIPAILFGAVAATTDWNQTAYGHPTILKEDLSLTLSLVYFHLTPVAVSFIGLGAVSAAVMSSTDSSILSASTMFACNVFSVIFQTITGRKPTEKTVVWVMRGSQVVIAGMACAIAISVSSIYYLFTLCSDFVFVILFPQLLCVLFIRWSNSYGSFAGYFIGLTLRIMGGEPRINLSPVLEYPWMDTSTGKQQFPFRTLTMLTSLSCILFFSFLASFLFRRRILPSTLDVFRCFQNTPRPPLNRREGEKVSADNPETETVFNGHNTVF